MTDYVSSKQADSITKIPDSYNMNQFMVGFIGAALWSNGDMSLGSQDDSEDTPMDANWAVVDVTEECQVQLADFVRHFYLLFSDDWLAVDYEDEQAGHDLALELGGHGVGFRDRINLEENELGKKLSEAVDKMFGYCSFECYGDSVNETAFMGVS